MRLSPSFAHSPQLTVDFHAECWRGARRLAIDRNWRGRKRRSELKTTAMVVWSRRDILRPECGYAELDVDEEFDVGVRERYALWDRDVLKPSSVRRSSRTRNITANSKSRRQGSGAI